MKKPIQKGNWILVDKDKKQMYVGDKVADFRGDPLTLDGGTPPACEGKAGYIYVKHSEGFTAQFYPSVCGLEWYLISGKG